MSWPAAVFDFIQMFLINLLTGKFTHMTMDMVGGKKSEQVGPTVANKIRTSMSVSSEQLVVVWFSYVLITFYHPVKMFMNSLVTFVLKTVQ